MAQPQPNHRQSDIDAQHTCDISVIHHGERRILKPNNVSRFQRYIDAYHCLKKVPFGVRGMRNGTLVALAQKQGADPNFRASNRALTDAVVETYNIQQFEKRIRQIYDADRSTAAIDAFTTDPHRVATDYTWLDVEDIPQPDFDLLEETYARQLGVRRA